MTRRSIVILFTCFIATVVVDRVLAGADVPEVAGVSEAEFSRQKEEVVQQIELTRRMLCGTGRPSAADRERAKWYRDRRAAVIAVAGDRFDAALLGTSGGSADEFGAAMNVLAAADPDAAAKFVQRRMRDVRAALSAVDPSYHRNKEALRAALGPEKWEHLMTLVGLRAELVEQCIYLNHSGMIEAVKELVESDPSTALLAARYLVGQSDRRPELRQFLQRKQQDPNSRLYRMLLLDRLNRTERTQGDAERTKGGPPKG